MKKILFFTLAACLIPAALQASGGLFRDGDAFVTAKAVKLGRDNSSAFGGLSVVDNSGENSTVEEGKDCDPNCDSNSCNRSTGKCSKCTSGRYLYDNLCLACPTGASCDDGKTFKCTGLRIASGRECKASCSGVSCKSGYSAVLNGSQCCCEVSSCPSGQRLSNGSCVSNCTGVSCKSGYKAVSSSTGCCCEADTPTCGTGKVYNTTIKKCVDAVCPTGCLDSCVNGCGSCASGRYLSYVDGYCPTCSSAIPNCATCSGSSSGATCTSCESGYTLTNGECVKSACGEGQLKIGGQCVQCYSGVNGCPSGSYRLSNGTCCAMPTGCTGFTNFDMSCTGCTSGYTLTNGRCVKDSVSCPIGTIRDPQTGLCTISTQIPTCTEVPGRGCCTPEQLKNPNMACFLKNDIGNATLN